MQSPTLIVFEGIDGSGKTTMAHAFLEDLADRGLKVFDLAAWGKREHRFPLPDECVNYDVIFAPEPTHTWIGAAIRSELIREGTTYSGRAIAEAFALDRLILHTRLLTPLRAMGKLIVQDRNASTSFIYQPTQKNSLTLEELMQLEGNAHTLTHAPDLLIIADCRPEVAFERLAKRTDKKDDAIFEKLETLRVFDARFKSDWFRKLWTDRSTTVRYLPSHVPADEMMESARSLAREVLAARQATTELV